MKRITKTNKLTCFLLVVILLMGNMIPAHAIGTPTISISNAFGKAGDTIVVKMSIANNPGFAGIEFKLGYDNTYLTPVKIAKNGSFITMYVANLEYSPNEIKVATATSSNINLNQDLFTITFKIKQNAPTTYTSTTIPLTLSVIYMANEFNNEITPTTVSGTVTIVPKALVSIAVEAKPTKLSYIEGDTFDLDGMVVKAYYDNGSSIVLTSNEYTITADLSIAGTKVVTVSYGNKSDSFTVEVTIKPFVTDVYFGNYKVSAENIITNVQPDQFPERFLSGLFVNNGTAILTDADGNPLAPGAKVGTGTKFNVDVNGSIIETYTIVIYGDVDCDGKIGLTDLVTVRNYLLENVTLSPSAKIAGDLYGEGDITLNSLVGIMAKVSETGTINQNR